MTKRRDRKRQDVNQPNVARDEIPDPSFIPPSNSDEALFGKPRQTASQLEKQIKNLKQEIQETREVLQVGDFILTNRGLNFVGETLAFEDWRTMGAYLQQHQDAIQWMIGDWANLAEPYLKDWASDIELDTDVPEGKYKWLAEQTDYSYSRLRNFSWVANQFPMSRRRDTLTFSHHMEVAHLSPSEQEEFLDRAEAGQDGKRLSTRALRELVQGPPELKDGPPKEASPIAKLLNRTERKLESWSKWSQAERKRAYEETKTLLKKMEALGFDD